jgi:hypothetical protein
MLVTLASSALMFVRDFTVLSCALSATVSAATAMATGNASLMRFAPFGSIRALVVQEPFRRAVSLRREADRYAVRRNEGRQSRI